MLVWAATKAFLNKTWETIKKYWKCLLAVAYGVGIWHFFRGKAERAKDVLDVTKGSHKKQVDVLDAAHKEEVDKRNKSLEKYHEIVKNLEGDHAEKRRVLSREEKSEIKKIVEKHAHNKKELAKMISERFDFQYAGDE